VTANVVSRARAVAVLLTAVYALAATMHAQNRRPDNTPVDDFAGYPALIEQYRNGQTKQAVEAVSGRTMFRIPDAIDDWLDQTIRERKVDLLRTALLLHTEAIFKDDRGGSLPNREIVRLLFKALAQDDKIDGFLQRWVLLWESFHQGMIFVLPRNSPDYLEMALLAEPQNADLLLAAGARHEMRWWKAGGNPQRDPAGRSSTDESLTKAIHYLRRSVAADAALAEARLRLAHVHLLAGEDAAAADDLRELSKLQVPVPLRYLALLFTGRLKERSGDRAGAIESYEAATKVVPLAQAARLALARIAFADGSRDDAARIATDAFRNTDSGSDPWWWYVHGLFWHLDYQLNALRTRVQVRTSAEVPR